MRISTSHLLTVVLVLSVFSGLTASAADDKDRVLRKLDVAAANFRSTSADFQTDAVQSDPIPDTETQKGSIYYERTGKKSFRMAAHIREINKKPTEKFYSYVAGTFKLFEGGNTDQVTTFTKASQFESYMMLGFGASGKDLEEKWEIKYLGPETLDGVKTEKLELVAKDAAVRKNFPKITVWMDTDRGISLKQIFDEGPGQYRVGVYFNIKVNQPLPADAFTFKTDKQTKFITR
jgi:outer membrane lipoprotein-sorting protein